MFLSSPSSGFTFLFHPIQIYTAVVPGGVRIVETRGNSFHMTSVETKMNGQFSMYT